MKPSLARQLRGVKGRLLYVLVSLGVGSATTWYFKTEVFHLLLTPANGALSPDGQPIFTSPTEMFSATLDLVMKGGLLTAIPVAAFHLYRLVSPLLGKRPRRLIKGYAALGLALWLGGTAFAYFILLPTSLRFLLHFGTDIATPMIRITEYMALAMAMLFWLGIVFELPLIMMLLAHLRLVSHKQFRKVPRRYILIAAFILGAIITPTFDAVNQTLVAVPLIVLYEVGVFLAWVVRPKGLAESNKKPWR